MRPYLAVFGARFRVLLQYRTAAAAGVVTQVFWGLVRAMILLAFYRASDATPPLSEAAMLTYVWLGQAMLAMLPWNRDPDVQALVRSGGVAYELLRPVDLHLFWYARSLARRTAPTLLRCGPIFLVGAFFGLSPPASWAAGAAWIVTTVGALLLGCAFATLLNVTLVWTLVGDGTWRIATGVVAVLSGMIVPLPLFPDTWQPVLRALPFAGMIDTPFRLYSGDLPVADLPWLLGHQLAWAAVLFLAGRWLLSRALHRLVVQGG